MNQSRPEYSNKRLRKSDYFNAGLLLGIYPIYALLSGQDVNWDQKNYHLYSAISFLRNNYQNDILPAGIQTFGNPLTSLPAWGLLQASRIGPAWLASCSLALVQGCSLVIIYLISRSILRGPRFHSLMASLIGGTGALVLSEVGNTMGDLTASILPLTSILIISRIATGETPPTRWRVALSGGLAGAACGLKLTFIFTLPLIGGLALWALRKPRPRTRRTNLIPWDASIYVSGSIAMLAGFLIFAAPMSYHSLANTGNPVFPYFNRAFNSKLHAPINWSDQRFKPASIRELLLAPIFSLTDSYYAPYRLEVGLATRRAEPIHSDPRPLLWIFSTGIVITSAIVTKKQHMILSGVFATLLTLSYFLFIKVTGIGRYGMPLDLLMGIPMLEAMSILLAAPVAIQANSQANPGATRRVKFSSITLMSLILFLQKTADWGRVGFQHHWTAIKPSQIKYGHSHYISAIPINEPVGAVVILRKGYSWIKAVLPSNTPLYLWDLGDQINYDTVRQKILNRIKENRPSPLYLLIDGKKRGKAILEAESFLESTGLGRHYQLTSCEAFRSFAGDRFQLCKLTNGVDPNKNTHAKSNASNDQGVSGKDSDK